MKILIAGEGGQGVQLIAELLAKAAFLEGKNSLYIPNFGVEQRGGVSLAFIVIDDKPTVYPKFEKAEILAILCDRAVDRIFHYIERKTKVILGPAVTQRKIKGIKKEEVFFIKPFWFPPKVWNILVLGKIISLLKTVSLASLRETMEEKLKDKFKKDPSLRELDERALAFNI